MTQDFYTHPCLCDVCLKARDAELARVRADLLSQHDAELIAELEKLAKYNGDYSQAGLELAASIIRNHK